MTDKWFSKICHAQQMMNIIKHLSLLRWIASTRCYADCMYTTKLWNDCTPQNCPAEKWFSFEYWMMSIYYVKYGWWMAITSSWNTMKKKLYKKSKYSDGTRLKMLKIICRGKGGRGLYSAPYSSFHCMFTHISRQNAHITYWII